MKKCKITVMRITRYEDLMAQYENPISHACDMEVGQVFIANGWTKPEGFCHSAWDTLSPFVLALSHGGAVDKVSSENVQWEYGQKKRRPLASFHGPYQPLQVQSGR